MSGTPRSSRLPWMRSGLLGLAVTMLPFAWVLDAASCGGVRSNEVELTGFDVIGRLEGESLVVAPVLLLLVVLTPVLAPRLKAPIARVLTQFLGLLVTGFCAWLVSFAMYFTIFGERDLKPAGGVVLALMAASVADAALRLAFSLQEWRRPQTPT